MTNRSGTTRTELFRLPKHAIASRGQRVRVVRPEDK